MTCPADLYAGTLWEFTVSDSERLPSDGWSLAFRFSGATNFPLTVTALPDNTGWLVRHTSANSATVAAGRYEWFALATKAGETTPIAQGYTQVAPNPATATGIDSRSYAEKTLEIVRALIQKRATAGMLEYEIAGRQAKFYSMPELIALESNLQHQVANERRAARLCQTGVNDNRILVRFSR